MADPASSEPGEALDSPRVYRTLVFAFAVWAAHFIASYGAVLVFPHGTTARIVAVAALVGAIGALLFRLRGLAKPRPPLALAALGIALAGIALGTFPAIVG